MRGYTKKFRSGIGIGYVSVMMIFAVICLTILAVLAFQAASSDEKLSEKNTDFTHEYYAADTEAKKTSSAVFSVPAAESSPLSLIIRVIAPSDDGMHRSSREMLSEPFSRT